MDSRSDRTDDPNRAADPLTRLRAGREPGDDLVPALALVIAGILVPLFVAARYEGHLELYVDPKEYSILVALGVGLAFWLFVEGVDIDRVTVFGTAIIAPMPVTIAVGLLAAVLELAWLGSSVVDDLFPYSLAITAAGALAVGLSLLTEQLSIRHPRLPERRRMALTAGATALFGIGAGVGIRYARPPSASLEDVRVHYSAAEASFSVFLDIDSTDLHVAVVAPDGTITRDQPFETDVERDWMMVRVAQPRGSLYRGQFEIRIGTLWGNTVDSMPISVEDGPVLSIQRVETEQFRPTETVVTATVENGGDVTGATAVDLRGAEGNELDRTTVGLEPGATTDTRFTIHRDDRDELFVTARLEGAETEADRRRVDRSEE